MLTRWLPTTRESGSGLLTGSGGLLDRLDRDLTRMEGMFRDFASPMSEFFQAGESFPRVDLRDEEKEYVLEADLPGFAREEIEVDVTADRVSLKGCHEETREEKGKRGFYRQERATGCFERMIGLPGEVKVEDVKASMKDGVLTMHLPKVAESRTRRIELTEQ